MTHHSMLSSFRLFRSFLLFRHLVLLPWIIVLPTFAQPPNTPQDQSWNRRISGTGEYKIVLEVSGRVETTRALKLPNPLDLKAICAAKQEAEASAFRSAESYLLSLEKAVDKRRYLPELVRLHNELGQLYSYRGNMPKAIEQFEAAYQGLQQVLRDKPEYVEDKIYLEEILGMLIVVLERASSPVPLTSSCRPAMAASSSTTSSASSAARVTWSAIARAPSRGRTPRAALA